MNRKWLSSLHEPGPVLLWRIGYALAACFITAVGSASTMSCTKFRL